LNGTISRELQYKHIMNISHKY